jgi:DNA-binding GntR family transcriptional regulator
VAGVHQKARRAAAWVDALPGTLDGSPHDVVLAALRRAILEGAARPGAVIPVEEVAARFTVSRIPVREALKTLIGEGLVDHLPREGYTVASLTFEELREFYLVRSVLEAAALAAAVRNAVPADDDEARSAYEALEVAVASGDSPSYHRESRRLHMAFLQPSRMHRLLRMVESAWNITEPVQPMAHVGEEGRSSLHQDHRAMLDAFLARDADALVAASTLHAGRLGQAIDTLPADLGAFRR